MNEQDEIAALKNELADYKNQIAQLARPFMPCEHATIQDENTRLRAELATLCTRAEKAEALINSSENPNVIRASELGYALARANERIASLEAALRPFAECVGYVDNRQDWPDDIPLWTRGRDGESLYTITSGDLRRAAAALAGKGGAE